MSLAIPYVLDAAAESAPDAVVIVASAALTMKELDRRTIGRTERYLDDDCQPGDRLAFPALDSTSGVIDALAGIRIGLVLCDTAALSPHLGLPRAARDVLESRIWSETLAASLAGGIVTHGGLIRGAVERRTGPEELEPVLAVLRSIMRAMPDSRPVR